MSRVLAMICRFTSRGVAAARRWVVAGLVVGVATGAHSQSGTAWNSLGPPGGSVSTLLASPASSSVLYAGTPENGVFFSADAGQTWTSANNGLPPSSATGRQTLYTVYALASGGQYVYAATAAGLFYSSAQGIPNWVPLAPTGATTPITLLAFDPQTQRLFAATNGSDGVNPLRVYVTALSGTPTAAWEASDLPVSPLAGTISSISLVPAQGSGVPGAILVGVGNGILTSPILPSTLALTWTSADSSGTLAAGTVTAVLYSNDFSQTYACSGSAGYFSGNVLDPVPVWLPITFASGASLGLNCNGLFSIGLAAGGAPQIVLAADQGALVSVDGVSFQATGATGPSPAVSALAVATDPGSATPSAVVGGPFGVSTVTLANLVGGANWSPRNGPASVASGGSNARLNNANVVDTEVIGTTLFAAVSSNQYAEVFASTDGGANWTATNIHNVLGSTESVKSLAADATNAILFAGTTQGLLAYSTASGQWSSVGASSILSVSAMKVGTSALMVGTDAGVFAVALGSSPATVVPTSAGLSASGVKALLVAGGKVYAAILDDTGAYPVLVASESSVVSGVPVWNPFGATPVGTDRVTGMLLVGDVVVASTNGGLVMYASAGSSWASANTSSDPAQQISDPFGVVNGLYTDGTSIYAATGSNGVFASPVGTTFSWYAINGAGDTALPSLEIHGLKGNGSTLYAATRAGMAAFDGLATSPTTPPPPPTSAASGSGGGGAMELGWLLGWLASIGGVFAVTPRRRER